MLNRGLSADNCFCPRQNNPPPYATVRLCSPDRNSRDRIIVIVIVKSCVVNRIQSESTSFYIIVLFPFVKNEYVKTGNRK